jgi:NAD(P)-dependent dehydrogenase (short-subunit alcohol dehydrogenase family)
MFVFANDALKEKHAIVTGATGGIGYKTAKVLASMGASVTITGRRKEKLDELAREIGKDFPDTTVLSYPADISAEKDRRNLVKAAEEANGLTSLLVNSAGISGGDTVDRLTKEEMDKIMDINYTSTVLLTQLVYNRMKAKQEGAVVNVASLSGLRGTYGNTAYAASKFALIGFTQSFAFEAIKHHVRVNAVCPGYVDTDMGRNAVQRRVDRENRSFETVVNDNIPSGRMTTPEEVANTIAYLLSNAAGNIVGESMKISGGSVMR